ncbi:MAG: hypothetical protein IPF82_11185 [Blastocatellia bacterium]|jgi:hypothetical protein|nr:hypothetical protein [Blastocatellia bacterium]
MKLTTYEATVENGLIKLPDDARLPDHTRVYVVVPDAVDIEGLRILSPRLADPETAADFVLDVTPESRDAGV